MNTDPLFHPGVEPLPTTALAEVNELLWSLSSSLDPQAIVAVLLERCTRLFRAPLAAVWVQHEGVFELAGLFGFTEKKAEQLWQRLQLERAGPQAVQLDGPALNALGGFGKRRLGSLIAVPLRTPQALGGWLVFVRLEPEPFSDLERSFLEILAGRVAVSLENANRYQQTRIRSRELELLNEISSLLVGSTRLDELLERLGPGMLETMSLSSCFVFLLEGEGPLLQPNSVHHRDPAMQAELRTYLATRPLRIDQGRSEEIFKTGKPILVSQVAEDPVVPEDIRTRVGGGSLLILPLQARGRFLGAMYLVRGSRGPALDEDVLPLATHVANQVSAAIATARLYDDLESKIAERTAHLQQVYENLAQRFSSGRDFFIQLSSTLKDDLAAIDAAQPSPEVRAAVDRLSAHLGQLFERLDRSPEV